MPAGRAAQILESIAEALVVFDRGWRCIHVNRLAEELLGREHGELLGRSLQEVFPAAGTAFEAACRRAASERSPVRFEEYDTPAGRWYVKRLYPFDEGLSVVLYDVTERKRLAGISEDINERKRMEEALRESEARLRALFEAAPIGIALVGAEGRPLECNSALERMLGYTGDELRDLSFSDFTHPEDVEADAELFRELNESRRDHYQIDKRYVRRDGRIVWGRLNVNLVRDGGRDRFVALVEDITGRKAAEEDLKRLSKAVECAGEAIGIAAADRKAVYLNPAAVELFGYTPEELNVGGGLDAVYADPEVGVEVSAALRRGRSWSGVVDVAQRGGGRIPVRLSADAIKDESGEIIGYFAAWSDLREINRLAEQLRQSQKIEAVGQLAGGVAHDFNNLLTVIIGYMNLSLKRLSAADPLRRNLEASLMAAERAADLTRQLLAFGRKQLLRPVPLRLDEVVSRIDRMLRRAIGDRVELTVATTPSLPHVEADRTQVELVILNLALNARDAMPNGGRLIIETYAEKLTTPHPALPLMPPGEYAVLQMEDTGHGMDAETQRHIFEPFFTTKVVGKGTGLGLSTVYGIVKQSGGYIIVESEAGAGTTFKVYLPRVNTSPAGSAEAAERKEPPRGTESVLLVDDDESVRTLAKEVLEGLGYRVLEAPGAEKAIALWEGCGGGIDLLFTDVVMPHVGGVELADALTQLSPGLKVLFMSGHTADAAIVGGLGERSLNFLQKPFTEEEVAQKLREVLGPSR